MHWRTNQVLANQPDTVVMDKDQKTEIVIDVLIPSDRKRNVENCQGTKRVIRKYVESEGKRVFQL